MRTSPEVEEVDTVEGDDDENLNVRAAIVHMVGDMVQSVGVIIAAIIIYIKPDWTIADPICTFLFTILVMFTTVPIFKDCMRFLMETAPEDIDQVEVYNGIKNVSSEMHILYTTLGVFLTILIFRSAFLRERDPRLPYVGPLGRQGHVHCPSRRDGQPKLRPLQRHRAAPEGVWHLPFDYSNGTRQKEPLHVRQARTSPMCQ